VKRLNMLKRDRRGIAVAEYGLIVAIVGATIAVASLALGSAVSDAITPVPNCPIGQTRC
jgi:Flp pilus assembly pilin Flp